MVDTEVTLTPVRKNVWLTPGRKVGERGWLWAGMEARARETSDTAHPSVLLPAGVGRTLQGTCSTSGEIDHWKDQA